MFISLPEVKVMRDPIHEYIHIDKQVIWDCINCDEFQRLRRIHQLGPAMYVYHTAEHSRFSHSLGVYEITRRMIKEIKGISNINEFDQLSLLCAALLHDIGHGPFSHSFEQLSGINHESFTIQLIQSNSKLHSILKDAHPELPQAIIDIIMHTHPNPLLSQIISGQLDADRMDYLLRDAYFSGTSYGKFDLERLLRTMRVVDDKLVVKASGVHSIEDYIMARYHMYWQVYYHPVSRSFEAILSSFFKRLRVLYQQDQESISELPAFIPFLNNRSVSNQNFLDMDEPTFMVGLKKACQHRDMILRDFARRILQRDLFGYEDVKDDAHADQMIQKIKKAGYDPDYYFAKGSASQTPYHPYHFKQQSIIWIVNEENVLMELSEASVIVKAITQGKEKEDIKMFFPKELR